MTVDKRPLIIAGNWKMHKTRAEAQLLAKALSQALTGEKDLPEIILCPPFTCIETVATAVYGSTIHIGAQNMDFHDAGAFTGEISPIMLKDMSVNYVIIGHSERRQFFNETNSIVNLKLKAALRHGLKPIVCVGETADERENNLTDAVVSRQVAAALTDLESNALKTLIIAYEPVWAIGTGKVCESKEAARVTKLIRSTVANIYSRQDLAQEIPVLYGGSIKASSIDEQMEQVEIDGGLVGGASLSFEEFLSIIKSAQKRIRLASQTV